MGSDIKIFWTKESLNNLDDILEYLKFVWTQKEVANFKTKLSKQLEIISKFPHLFPASHLNPDLKKAVLSKQTTIFYQFKNGCIYIIYLFDTRQDPDKLK